MSKEIGEREKQLKVLAAETRAGKNARAKPPIGELRTMMAEAAKKRGRPRKAKK